MHSHHETQTSTAANEEGSEKSMNTEYSDLDGHGVEPLAKVDSQSQYEETEDFEEQKPIKWINVIFIPFLGWWQILILFIVCSKSFFGPVTAIYPQLRCVSRKIEGEFLYQLFWGWFNFYVLVSDFVYLVDTFLYIVHRQVTDEALKREHLPKSGIFLVLDIISMIPFFPLLVEDLCVQPIVIWPNIVCFTEMVLLYRISHYFSLAWTHSYLNLFVGYSLIFFLVVSGLTCFLVLVTNHGLCAKCTNNRLYDWRTYKWRNNETIKEEALLMYASNYVISVIIHYIVDDIKPATYSEFILFIILSDLGFLIFMTIVRPKLFAESTLRYMKIYQFQPRVKRILTELKGRNPDAYNEVYNFYSMMWVKQNGLLVIPRVIYALPHNLRVDMRFELAWPVFYHSPTFRSTSHSYKRWLSEHVTLQYKLPGERFFTGLHCYSKLYYIKSGIVQLQSSDDSIAGTLSVTSGTIFGDTSFYTPPINRKVFAKCLTYCEVFSMSRSHILRSLHLFPEDRLIIMKQARARVKHGRDLYKIKQSYFRAENQVSRPEIEGLAWLKRRWWEISDYIKEWKESCSKTPCVLPPEETHYHCPKYIGQLVLCKDELLQTKSLFLKFDFPWSLVPNSTFSRVWHKLITYIITLLLFALPPILLRIQLNMPVLWFNEFMFIIDVIYCSDLIVTIITAEEGKEFEEPSFMGVIMERFKERTFTLDILSTPIVDCIFVLPDFSRYKVLGHFNRLFKSYILFQNRYRTTWPQHTLTEVCLRFTLIVFIAMYVTAFFLFVLVDIQEEVTPGFFFGDMCVNRSSVSTQCRRVTQTDIVTNIILQWIKAMLIFSDTASSKANTLVDLMLENIVMTSYVLLFMFIEMSFVAVLYCKDRQMAKFQFYVGKWVTFNERWNIHPELMKRFKRFIHVHWRRDKGRQFMQANLLKDEPYDVYWNVHGQHAEKIIGASRAFIGAHKSLIKELGQKATFSIMPRKCTVLAFGVFSESVNYLVRGKVTYEFRAGLNKTMRGFLTPGEIIACPTIFFGQACVANYYASTDVEILSISIQDFVNIIQHYPQEWAYFDHSIEELAPAFDKVYSDILQFHLDNKIQPRGQTYNIDLLNPDLPPKKKETNKILTFLKNYRSNPESGFIRLWMGIRVTAFFGVMTCTALLGGPAVFYYSFMKKLIAIFDSIAILDIIIKLFVPYYNEDGIVISDVRKCMVHYMTRGFFIDVVGALVIWTTTVKAILGDEDFITILLVQRIVKGLSVYLFLGFFDYYTNTPLRRSSYITLLKWNLTTILIMLQAANFYTKQCLQILYNMNTGKMVITQKNLTCWMPAYYDWKQRTAEENVNLVFVQAITIVQGAFFLNPIGQIVFEQKEENLQAIFFIFFATYFMYQKCVCQAAIILSQRGDLLIKHAVHQLRGFMENERISKDIIHRAIHQYNHWWKRTSGVKKDMYKSRLSLVFRQDLNFFFYKRTLKSLNTILHGGESMIRQLSAHCVVWYYIANGDVIREMQLSDSVFVVHRGKFEVLQKGEKLATLTKGCMFGNIDKHTTRPVKITVRADGKADVLRVPCDMFQSVITSEVRKTIASNPVSKNDYMVLDKYIPENPAATIEYLSRDAKVILLPGMTKPVSAHKKTWYYRWLLWCWVISPVLSTTVVQLYGISRDNQTIERYLMSIIYLFDFLHVLYLISEGFTVQLTIVLDKCELRYLGWKKLTAWWLYIDLLTILIPILSPNSYYMQLTRLLRIFSIVLYQHHFCDNFNTRKSQNGVRLVLYFLLVHTITCGWITTNCRDGEGDPFPVTNILWTFPNASLDKIDFDEWTDPDNRTGGCPRTTETYSTASRKIVKAFVVPVNWMADYLVALTYIIVLQTHTNLDIVLPLTTYGVLYRIFIQHVLYLVWLWIGSLAINTAYTRIGQLYTYDHQVHDLIKYMKTNGVCISLLQYVSKYTRILWKKHQGNQLPAIVRSVPKCLQEDIFSALYIYHLQTPMLLRDLPDYFLNQLVDRLQRSIIFPGKYIVQEGDIHPCLYFIHEGEVEKWYIDKRGDNRMASVLTINGFFGILPCLFPDMPYKFSYLSRTIVDVVYLHHHQWKDLLEFYPDVRQELYTKAQKLIPKIYRKKE